MYNMKKYNFKLTKNEIKLLTRDEKINYYCNYTDALNISGNNSKIGRGVFALSFPIEKTCNKNASCYKNRTCYAMHGTQHFACVVGAYERNLRLFNRDRGAFWAQVQENINRRKISVLRLFDAGDAPSVDFWHGVARLARNNPELIIYGYTKKIDLYAQFLQEGGILPDNIILWASQDNALKLTRATTCGLPIASVVGLHDIGENAFICPSRAGHMVTCTACKYCFSRDIITKHGGRVAFLPHGAGTASINDIFKEGARA